MSIEFYILIVCGYLLIGAAVVSLLARFNPESKISLIENMEDLDGPRKAVFLLSLYMTWPYGVYIKIIDAIYGDGDEEDD